MAGGADAESSVSSPERRKPKKARQDAAHIRRVSTSESIPEAQEARRDLMTELVIGRRCLPRSVLERCTPFRIYCKRGHSDLEGAVRPAVICKWRRAER